jgi:uncharacterized damage-inducible protein DinB
MPEIDPILAELSREAQTTRRVLERIPQDKLAWRPHAKSKTIGELAWHVAAIPGRIAMVVQEDEVDAAKFPQLPMPETAAGIVEGFDQSVARARELLGRLDDAALERTTTLRRGDRAIFSGPKRELLRAVMLNHSYHHRGQLSVYLRLLDVPVPSIYGPTADEP